MVKSKKIFNSIACTDTLLSFDAVVPSLSDLQLKLILLINQFYDALLTEKQNEKDTEKLCKCLCGYLDKHVNESFKDSLISWDKYKLKDYFYGYQNESESSEEMLTKLTHSRDKHIRYFAFRLLKLKLKSINNPLLEHHIDTDNEIKSLSSSSAVKINQTPAIVKESTIEKSSEADEKENNLAVLAPSILGYPTHLFIIYIGFLIALTVCLINYFGNLS